MKNDNNYALEAFDYNFIIIISQRGSSGRCKLKYAKISRKVTGYLYIICY